MSKLKTIVKHPVTSLASVSHLKRDNNYLHVVGKYLVTTQNKNGEKDNFNIIIRETIPADTKVTAITLTPPFVQVVNFADLKKSDVFLIRYASGTPGNFKLA